MQINKRNSTAEEQFITQNLPYLYGIIQLLLSVTTFLGIEHHSDKVIYFRSLEFVLVLTSKGLSTKVSLPAGVCILIFAFFQLMSLKSFLSSSCGCVWPHCDHFVGQILNNYSLKRLMCFWQFSQNVTKNRPAGGHFNEPCIFWIYFTKFWFPS